jgi:hypothetical protein
MKQYNKKRVPPCHPNSSALGKSLMHSISLIDSLKLPTTKHSMSIQDEIKLRIYIYGIEVRVVHTV